MVADAAADIWALGVVAFELMTYEPAFSQLTARREIDDMHLGKRPLPWEAGGEKHARMGELRGMQASVQQCLSHNPGDRPSAADLIAAWDRMFDRGATQRA